MANGIYDTNTELAGPYQGSQPGVNPAGLGAKVGAAMAGGAIMGGGVPGALIMGGITLLGGLIQGITARKPPLTPEQRYFQDMTQYYYKLGERFNYANSYKNAVAGKAVFRNIPDFKTMTRDYPYPEPAGE